MRVINGGLSLILGWQDTLLTVEKRLWRAGKEALRGVHSSGCHAGEMAAMDMLMEPEPSD